MTPFFWEDATQAQERLQGSTILYKDVPVYVEMVSGRKGDVIAAVAIPADPKLHEISLSDEGFHLFRKLPVLGWFNHHGTSRALYLDRQSTRSRTHGYTDNNVRVGNLEDDATELFFRNYRFSTASRDEGYVDSNQGKYPNLVEVLSVIRTGSTIAVSPKFAIHRDKAGLRWLFHGMNRVGVFADTETLLLMGRFSFMKEEIEESSLNISSIREF